MTRETALKAAAMKGSIETISRLIEALEQQRQAIQIQLDAVFNADSLD